MLIKIEIAVKSLKIRFPLHFIECLLRCIKAFCPNKSMLVCVSSSGLHTRLAKELLLR